MLRVAAYLGFRAAPLFRDPHPFPPGATAAAAPLTSGFAYEPDLNPAVTLLCSGTVKLEKGLQF